MFFIWNESKIYKILTITINWGKRIKKFIKNYKKNKNEYDYFYHKFIDNK